jgi:L-fuconolactonase
VTLDDEATYRGSMPRSTAKLQQWHAAVLQEEVLDPDLPIVDPHHHLYGTPTDTNYYRIEDLQQDLSAGHRIVGTVYMEAYKSGWRSTGPQALRSIGEIEMIRKATPVPIAVGHGLCHVAAAIVSNVDLTLGDAVSQVLEAHLEGAGGRLRGVRHHLATAGGLVGRYIKEPPRQNLLSDPAFRRGYSHLQHHDMCFDAWIYQHQLDELVDIADAFEHTPIVLNHLGTVIGVGEFRTQRPDVIAKWRSQMRSLAARPNVVVKLGGLGMPVFGFGFENMQRPATSSELAQAWQPLVEETIEAFGTSRCMFESNYPVDKQSCGYLALWNAFKRITRSMSSDERCDLFYGTACRTYRLPELQALADQT